jgi:glycosyltransferase involved in cell wall biosynthesis
VWPDTTLKLFGVANLSFHHGYDRIIKAIHQWKNIPNRPYNISFTIAGSGPYLNNLKQLTKELGVGSEVKYVGSKNWKELHELYSTNHLAVSSIGLHRLGLTEASVLKAREYCLAGMPFIAAASDPDFSTKCAFRININNSDTIDDIILIFNKFSEIRLKFSDEEIRTYALKQLSFESKLKKLGINPIYAYGNQKH